MRQFEDLDMSMLGVGVPQGPMGWLPGERKPEGCGLRIMIQIRDRWWGHTGSQRGQSDSCSLAQPHAPCWKLQSEKGQRELHELFKGSS